MDYGQVFLIACISAVVIFAVTLFTASLIAPGKR